MNELLTGLQLEISLYPLLGYLLGAAAILLITAVAEKICTFVLRRFIREAENRGIAGLGNFLAAFVKPLRYLVYLLGIYLAIRYLPLTQSADIMTGQICRSLLIIILGMGFYDLCAIDSLFSEEIRNNLHLDIILLPFFSKLLRFIIIALVIVLVANEWGYEVNGFIAGLGLGGLAVALAAREMLANLFAGIVLIMEKPFILGENISTPRVQGKVEDISFRSTKIRAGDQSLVTVPNATLANEPITNLSRMDKRKISFYVSLAADTPAEKILSCMDKIKQLLLNTPGLQEDGIKVNLEILSASSIDILVSCFTVGNQGEDYLANRQIINLGIIEILRQENLTMAASTANIK